MPEQLLLDLEFTTELPPDNILDNVRRIARGELQRAILKWLASHGAAAAATRVPTRRSTYRADIAAFWNKTARQSGRGGKVTVNTVTRTLVIETRTSRAACWPDCANSAELLPQLRDGNRRLRALEEQIRKDEPHLKTCGSLFDEYADWNYSGSANAAFQSLRAEVSSLESALYRGTRFESLRDQAIADQLYLAVPENTVHPSEVAAGWGLIWVNDNHEITLVTPASELDSPDPVRTHLMQNIAASAFADVLFRNGISSDSNGHYFRRVPKRRNRGKA